MDTKQNLAIVVRLAWRNVWKNKRRTILTLLTIVVGSTVIIMMNAWARGGHDQMIEDAVAVNTGHIQIHEKGFWDNKTLGYCFEASNELIGELEKNPKIVAYSKRVHAGGLISFKGITKGALIQGVDPQKEKTVSTIYNKKTMLSGGRYLEPGDKTNIVLGNVLANNLGAGVGDTVAMVSQGQDGSTASEFLTIVGLFKSGNPEYDRALIIMPLEQTMETFSMMGNISSIVVRVEDSSDIESVRNDIEKFINKGKKAQAGSSTSAEAAIDEIPEEVEFDEETGISEIVSEAREMEVMGWDELMPEMVQFIVMDDIGAYIFDFILFMVVAFGILNTIQMAVFERIREFGIMLAIGTKPGQVIAMVLFESVFITLVGVTLGLILGASLGYYFQVSPIEIPQYAEEMAVWGVSSVKFPAKITLLNVSVTVGLTFVLSLLFSIVPARKASKLNPIEAIRHL
ncbi:MAG: ABC transporter permease [bacterium]|nr:ABC transporter permease [bacterium]